MSCNEKNPLTREGTSLMNRELAALSTQYARVDERDIIDLSLFAKRYAAFLNYFDATNTLTGNWQPLIEFDVSVILASLARLDANQNINYKKQLLNQIRISPDDATAKRDFKFLFDFLFSLARFVDHQFQLLPTDFEFKNEIKNFIAAKLNDPLANLEQYFAEYKVATLLDYSVAELDPEAPIAVVSDETFTRMNLSDPWRGPAILVGITLPSIPGIRERIVYVANHNIFNSQVELLLNGFASLAVKAAAIFEKTIERYPQHSPHMALFLAWLKLFSHEQEALNTYTQRHLDFYYKEVLQLVNKPAEPDSAHLVFELQKPVQEHRLVDGILFKGGKDAIGKEISYQLPEDIVLNKANVVSLKAWQKVYKGRELVKTYPIANSEDGEGAKLTAADKSWFSFGNPKISKTGKFGFAIASNLLFLNEGERTIRLTAEFSAPLQGLAFPAIYDSNCFSAQYSGAKKWLDTAPPLVQSNPAGTILTFTISLSPDAAAMVPYSEKVHAANFGIDTPVLKIYLDQDNSNSIPYTILSKANMTKLTLNVGVVGVRDLMLSHDGGAIDASKPFKPFGDFPGYGAGFYIGSKELFQKKLTQLVVNTKWKTPYYGPTFDGSASYLRQSIWGKDQFNIFNSTGSHTINFSGGNHFTPTPPDYTKNEPLTANTLEGFIQFRLAEYQYSLDSHMTEISTALSHTRIKSIDDDPQTYAISVAKTPVPKEIVLNALSLNYVASTTISLDDGASADNDLLLQLTPFGFKHVSSSLADTSPDAEVINAITLIPDIPNVGELFVGIANAESKQVVNILFQISEGSSNPLREMEELKWFYLAANNNWKLFKPEGIVDRTENLTQSGIVTLTIPPDASTDHSILDNNMHWIKLSADPYADAVCKLILVQAQSAKVDLVQDFDRQIEYRQVLPAKTISKFVVSDATVKSIDQPFDSFNGRTRETDEHFYVRVSERLRHKQRAITIWDYEHIILERFQKIFKVKCINHAGFYLENGKEVFCENFPGHVSIITLPNLLLKTNVNPLRPYTPIGWLVNISDYLKTIISPFVQLHVKNPQFEEIQLDFKVKFYEHLSEAFYLDLLNKEIEQFLCPWAFDNDKEISFGGKIYKSAVLNFVEERPYVDFVTCFKMNHYIQRDENGVKVELDVEVAQGSTARSILVSYYDEDTNTRHLISSPAECTC